jgi:copper chaperone CopZ
MYRFLLSACVFLLIHGHIFSQNVISLTVGGACGMCTDRIEKTAAGVSGVISATYDLDQQVLEAEVSENFNKQILIDALLAVGHDTEGQKADDDIYDSLPGCCWYREDVSHDDTMPEMTSENSISIDVSGICGMCEERIESTALGVIGVEFADYDLDKQELTVNFDKDLFRKSELVQALLLTGHDADGQTAPDEVYLQLHACCKYRDDEPKVHPESAAEKKNTLFGNVYEETPEGKTIPLIGATIHWAGTNTGTISDMNGYFSIKMSKKSRQLVISYVGYQPDTIVVDKAGAANIIISSSVNMLDVVEVSFKTKTTSVSYLDPIKVQQISSKELLKAACCNLAESFETTPSVDAGITDAVTGTRKIEMLGLAGPYVQIMRENMPDVRGLAALQGLSLTPGPWVSGMGLNMGAGSVVNGFESFSGQINVENKKPCHDETLHLNAYASHQGRLEMNTFSKNEINENWSTANLLHASTRILVMDNNDDGFMDIPLSQQFGFMNRWKWTDNNGQEGQIGMKLSYMDNTSGQTDFNPRRSLRDQVWGADMSTKRAEVWAKRGFVNMDKPYRTFGFQFAGSYHDQKGQFGLRRYDATQKSIYFNGIHQNIIVDTDHQIRMGASFQWDQFNEVVGEETFDRNEYVPGVFGEYTYKGSEKFTVLAGLRGDYHNNFGFFATPRLNLRYAPTDKTVFRFAGGRSQRTASVFAENIGFFASNRQFILEGGDTNDKPYGLNPEVAWTLGLSMTQDIHIGSRILSLAADWNRIDFTNQIVVDLDRSARQVAFYNLVGESFTQSIQIQADMDVTDWMDIRLAYRYNDVRTTYDGQLLQRPLYSPERSFLNVVIRPAEGWSIDYTINRLGEVRIPSLLDNDVIHRWPEYSEPYFLSNAQISKNWNDGLFELYLGGENIFNFRLEEAIIGADNPFGNFFDASMAWAPVMGVNVYLGIRYTLR